MRTTDGIFCAGVDHHATPLAAREALASLAGDRLTPHLIEHEGAEEVVLLSTCNRVEIYGRSGRRGPEIAAALGRAMPADLAEIWNQTPGVYLHEGLACWRHLSEVAAGLRSMVMGEAEILGQVRVAYQASREVGGTGKAMHSLFQSTLSPGYPAIPPMLLLGAGHTARSFGMAAQEKGFRKIWISSRTEQRAASLARDLGGETVPWSRWGEAARVSGVVVSALSGGELLWREPSESTGPTALVDLGVPRTLTQVRAFYPQAIWLDLEELAKRSEMVPESLGAIHRAEEILRSQERIWLNSGLRAANLLPGGGG